MEIKGLTLLSDFQAVFEIDHCYFLRNACFELSMGSCACFTWENLFSHCKHCLMKLFTWQALCQKSQSNN